MLSKNHSALRSILKQEQGEKIAPCISNLNNTQAIEYLNGENIIYEVYKEENALKRDSKNQERNGNWNRGSVAYDVPQCAIRHSSRHHQHGSR
jgi:hypothetical protein